MASTRGIKRKFSDIQMVLLVVGREETEISVHENVLFEASPVFKAAFTSRFKESSERSIHLPEDDATLMDILIQSLYAPESRLDEIDITMELFRLYVLADKYDIVKVRNKICERVRVSLLSEIISPAPGIQPIAQISMSAVKFVYENTTSKIAMRRLLVGWFGWVVDSTWINEEKNRTWLMSVPEFAVDVCAVLAKDSDKKANSPPCMSKRWVYLEEERVGDKS